jgi:hypothetical protein
MLYSSQYSLPLLFNRYLTIVSLRELPTRTRMSFDKDTYVIRSHHYYVAYRTWMKVIPLIETFDLGQEAELVNWLEQFGYEFESEAFQPWFSQCAIYPVAELT